MIYAYEKSWPSEKSICEDLRCEKNEEDKNYDDPEIEQQEQQ